MSDLPSYLIPAAHRYGESKLALWLGVEAHRAGAAAPTAPAPEHVQSTKTVAATPAVAAAVTGPVGAPEDAKVCECSVAFRNGEPCPHPTGPGSGLHRHKFPSGGIIKIRYTADACFKEYKSKPKTADGNGKAVAPPKKKKSQKPEAAKQPPSAVAVAEQEGDVEDVVERYEEDDDDENDEPLVKRTKVVEQDDDDDDDGDLVMEME
jgi:hypothetical protein